MHICPHCGRHQSDPRDYLVLGYRPQTLASLEWIRIRAYSDEEALRQVAMLEPEYSRHQIRLIVPFHAGVDPQHPDRVPDKMPYGRWVTEDIAKSFYGVQPADESLPASIQP